MKSLALHADGKAKALNYPMAIIVRHMQYAIWIARLVENKSDSGKHHCK